MNAKTHLKLLGGLSAEEFMSRYWQRQPLLIRQALPAFQPPLSIAAVKRLAYCDEVESRLIWRENSTWHMEKGPFSKLPRAKDPDWTLLVQSVDLHNDAACELMQQFRFVPDARLDDMMVSIATKGGGVGPHFDSYDVFLLQAVGQRRWRISRQRNLSYKPDLPIKILQKFVTQQEYLLNPGDMLYLPPHVAHDGIALSDCMTLSIGFRAPTYAALAQGMLEAAADQLLARNGTPASAYADPPLPGPRLNNHYRDKKQPATSHPAQLPQTLVEATLSAVQKIRFDQALAIRFLGCWLTETHPLARFYPNDSALNLIQDWPAEGQLVLDRCTRILYRAKHLFINGELASIRASRVLFQLADERYLNCSKTLSRHLSLPICTCLNAWLQAGWLHYKTTNENKRLK